MAGRGGLSAPQATAAAFAGPVRHVYVHVPFCMARCDYCDFDAEAVGVAVPPPARGAAAPVAAAGGVAAAAPGRVAASPVAALFDAYAGAVAAEWERERAAHGVRRVETLYFGGGTPALLGAERLERLVATFAPWLTPRAEVTVETNPDEADDAFAAWAGGRGVRVSLGVQSFLPELRAALGRRPSADPAAAARRLRAAGVRDLSVDLMHGIPGQTAAKLAADLAAVDDLSPDHVSWYELGIVRGTPLARRLRDDGRAGGVADAGGSDPVAGRAAGASLRAALPGEDARAALYREVVRGLQGRGYRWYEVSSFARPGRRARHNVAYWRARPYLGLGPGAVSTVGSLRWRNAAGSASSVEELGAGRPPRRRAEALDGETLARERLLLAARCGLAVPCSEIALAVDADAAVPLVTAGLLSLHSGTIRVTRKGRYVANEVCVRLFRA